MVSEAQKRAVKKYRSEHYDKLLAWNRNYRERHKEELAEKKKVKDRQKRDAILVALITEYAGGATIKDLCKKYRVGVRKEK